MPETPSPEGTIAERVIGDDGTVWTFAAKGDVMRNGASANGWSGDKRFFKGQGLILVKAGPWYRWTGSGFELYGDKPPVSTPTPPEPSPVIVGVAPVVTLSVQAPQGYSVELATSGQQIALTLKKKP